MVRASTFPCGLIFCGHDYSWISLIQEALELIFAACTTDSLYFEEPGIVGGLVRQRP